MFKTSSFRFVRHGTSHRCLGGGSTNVVEAFLGLGGPPGDVHGLELVKAGEHTGAGDSTEDVGSSTLHQGHETLVLHDLDEAVHGALVLDTTAGGHHHPPPHRVNGVGHESSSDGDSPSKEEGEENSSVLAEQQRLQSVVEAEVHATVDEDTNCRDGEASVQALDAIGLQSLHVDVDQAVELALTTLALGVVSQPGPGVVEGVYEEQGHGTGGATAGNVCGELQGLGGVLGGLEGGLDGILEGKVKRLSWEVPQHVRHVSSPEGVDSLRCQHTLGAVKHSIVWLVKTTLLDHLILVLDEQLDPLDGGGGGLGHAGSHAGEHERLKESKLLVSHNEVRVAVSLKKCYQA